MSVCLLKFLRKFINVLGGLIFFFSFFLIIRALVLYCSVLCSFCWILFSMWNLFNLYLLVLFHLLKVFVSDASVSSLYPFGFFFPKHTDAPHTFWASATVFTGIQTQEEAFETNQCQNDIAQGKGCTQRHTIPGTSYFCFPLNTGWMAACQPSCQNLWGMLFTSLCTCALNNNCGMRQRKPHKRGELRLHAKRCTAMHASERKEQTEAHAPLCGD